VNRDRKLSVLEALLERVRNRAASPRASTSSTASSIAAPANPQPPPSPPEEASAPSPPHAIAVPAAIASGVSPIAESPSTSDVPTDVRGVSVPPRDELASEPPGPEPDEEEGPPSAPRLREGISAPDERIEDEEAEAREQEFQEDEGPLKTPPPESGRQHVAAPAASAADASDELEIDISVTEGEAPVRPIALVSEPEINLHVQPQASPVAPPSAAAAEPQSELGSASAGGEPDRPLTKPSAGGEPDRPLTKPSAGGEPDRPLTKPSVVPLPVAEHPPASSPPPVRLMAQAPAQAEGATAAPVEVWASTHLPSALRGQVASFVGQNATFAPKSFGELLDASLQLGE